MNPLFLALLAHAFLGRRPTGRPNSKRPARKTRLPRQVSVQQLERKDLMARVTWAVEDGGNGHQYEVVAMNTDLMAARALAHTMGGHLVTIGSPAEEAFIYDLASSERAQSAWIGALGGTGLFPDDHWEWVTGEPMEYQLWGGSEPNNFQNTGEWGVQLRSPSDWNDIGPSARLPFVVEYDGLLDQGLDESPHALNDSMTLALNLGSIDALTTINASLREIADIDWYQFQSGSKGVLTLRIPATPHFSLDYFSWNGQFTEPQLKLPDLAEYKFNVEAGETYRFGFGNFFVTQEIPYQIVIAPPGYELPAAPDRLLSGVSDNIQIEETLADGKTKYYGLENRSQVAVQADLVFDKSQGDLRVELINPKREVLAVGQLTDTGVTLSHTLVNDLLAANSRPYWPLYLKVSARGGEVRYALNATARPVTRNNPALAHDLGSASAGLEITETFQRARRFQFTAAESGPMHIMVTGLTLTGRLQLLDDQGNLITESETIYAIGGARLVSFDAVQGKTYQIWGAFSSTAAIDSRQQTVRIKFLQDSTMEIEPNNDSESSQSLGRRSEWVVSATAAPSGEDDSRKDVFTLVANQTGDLYVGASRPNARVASSVAVYANDTRILVTERPGFRRTVHKGDVIRIEVDQSPDQSPYTLYGRIIPVAAKDDVYEFNELDGHPTVLPLPTGITALYYPLLHSAMDVDAFEFTGRPAVYRAEVAITTGLADPERFNVRVRNAETREVVAVGTPVGNMFTADFISYGGRYTLEVASGAAGYSPMRYLPQIVRKSPPTALLQSAIGAQLGHYAQTATIGLLNVKFVGDIDLSLINANKDGSSFGTAKVGLFSEQGVLIERIIADGDGPIRFSVRPGNYFLGLTTDSPQSIIADVRYIRVPGDVNGDGTVNIADFALLRSNFDQAVAPFTRGDLNGDGFVSLADFALMRSHFNRRR